MVNRIRDVVVTNHRLDPLETELRVTVALEKLTPESEIKGRLMGPRSVYASTVEVAYPLREVSRSNQLELRAVIPEPSWWTPETPFLYQGPLELWQNGELCERVQISHGIRRLQLSPSGLKLNGKGYVLRGKLGENTYVESEIRQCRDEGFNTLVTSLTQWQSGPELWALADRYGVFVIEQTNIPSRFLRWRNQSVDHVSVLGWIVLPALLDPSNFGVYDLRPNQASQLFGVAASTDPIPANAAFVLCTVQELESTESLDRAKIVLAKRLPEMPPSRSDVIGWIETI